MTQDRKPTGPQGATGRPALPAGLPAAERWQRLGGGHWSEVWRALLADGRDVVVKRSSYPAEIEADGLRALAAAGAPVPEVYAAEGEVLVMAYVRTPPGRGSRWEGLGAALARAHRVTADRYGWRRDNRIGPLVQPNTWHSEWPVFFATCRIRPHLDAEALPSDVRRRIEQALDGALLDLLPPRPPASLIHGDLWAGNVVGGRWLVDPAVAHADREYELAFMALFSGLPPALWATYEEAWPLEDGWRERRPALQLPHLLVHVRIFGASYVPAVVDRLDRLGW